MPVAGLAPRALRPAYQLVNLALLAAVASDLAQLEDERVGDAQRQALGPLDDLDCWSFEDLFEPERRRLRGVEAVEVEVEQAAALALVLAHQRVGGGLHLLGRDAEAGRDALREHRLAGGEVAEQQQRARRQQLGQQLLADAPRLRRRAGAPTARLRRRARAPTARLCRRARAPGSRRRGHRAAPRRS